MATDALRGLASLRAYYRLRESDPPCPPIIKGALFHDAIKIVIWTAEMHQAATVGAVEAFVGTKLPQWPSFEMEYWWLGDFDMPARDPVTGHQLRAMSALLLPGREGLGSVVFAMPKDPHLPLRLGMSVDRTGDTVTSRVTCGWLAMKAFMETKIAALEPAMADRAERRRFVKHEGPLPDVRIIQLRQRDASDNTAADREYRHRWIVKGHWRRLHEPRKADGAEVTFVNSYVKGPDDAPLLQPRESVYVVAR